MLKSISHGISARVAPYQLEGRRPRGLIWRPRADMPCDMDFNMYYSIYHRYYKAKIVEIDEDKILLYLTRYLVDRLVFL
jgi:hypothetical protein